MKPRRVVGLGLCVRDQFLVVDSLDFQGDRIRFTDSFQRTGGMVTTALAQAASLSCEAHLLSVIGDDTHGKAIRRDLRAKEIHAGHLLSDTRFDTAVCYVLVDKTSGERRFLAGQRREIENQASAFDLNAIHKNSILLLDGHFDVQATRAAKHARKLGVPVVADFNRPSAPLLDLLPYVDYPILPEEFSNDYAGGRHEVTLRRLAKDYGGTPIVTLGAKGGMYLHEGKQKRYARHRVRTVDTTGAGDCFHGAFAAGLAYRFDIDDAIRLAARAAGLACTARGGQGRLMTKPEMDDFMSNA